jgi:hypothetical protein
MRVRTGVATGAVLLATLGAATTTDAAPVAPDAGAAASSCVPKRNLEAIVDDSGSMSFTDSNNLRLRALELFIDTPGNEKTTLGAVEFGTDATKLFSPALIGSSGTQMKAAANAAIKSDGGGTDYNNAFALAGTENPTANGRIFLTDGGHLAALPYAEGHRGGPPVYVIGLSPGVGTDYEKLLQRIASESGGFYRRVDSAIDLQPAIVDVNAAVSCLATPVTYKDTFTKQGQSKPRTVPVPKGMHSLNITLSWADAANRFDVSGFKVIRKGKTVARATKVKPRKLKVVRRQGTTFLTVKVSKLVRGKLRFKLRAATLSTGTSVSLTTQASRVGK